LGVPVVAVASHGPTEIVEDGVSGLLLPTGSPAELAAALAPLVADPARRAAFSAAGRARQAELFGEERMLSEFRRTFHSLAQELRAGRAA
jgi:glycosyltransferase involved in cell wall biosynthesis